MGSWLSDREQRLVAGAETASAATPIPTQIVSNGEYLPPPQSETQKRVEQRILELADDHGKRLGLSRRQFMQTGCGMAAAFLAMNEIFGPRVRGRRGRGARARADRRRARRAWPASSSSTCRPTSCATTSSRRSCSAWPSSPAQHWNPEIKGETTPRSPLQVRELRQGDLLRQRHQRRAAVRRALRRSDAGGF